LHLVAEGVETSEQLECLRELGVETGQGFFFARPMSAEACLPVLENLAAARRLSDTGKLRLVASGEPAA
ncbi:MAG: EAL domain-containing protein, partial [Steroidobacteraceae bacterium]